MADNRDVVAGVNNMDDHDDEALAKQISPQRHDEEEVDGHMSEPSGPNVLDEAHEVDLYSNADEEHPAELNSRDEIENAQKNHERGYDEIADDDTEE